MNLWRTVAKSRSRKRHAGGAVWRLGALFLALALVLTPYSAVHAADDPVYVLGVELDSVSQPVPITVENDTPYTINAWATVSNTSNKKLVTDEATWTSSSSLIKVSKGVITATGEVASATVTAKYQGFAASITVKSSYAYKEVKLEIGGAEAPSKKDVELDDDVALKAIAVDDSGNRTDVTDKATWSTSSTAVATVDDGKVTLVAAGTATITVKHKGRTDTIELTVTSPYKSIEIGTPKGSDQIELFIGSETEPTKLTARPKLQNDTWGDFITDDAAWTSSNSAVVKVEKGVVTAVGAGTATVTAKRYGVSASVTFYVRTEYEAMKLYPSKPIAFTLYGEGVQLQMKVSKGTDEAEDKTAAAEWKVADSFVAAIEKTTDSGGNTTVRVVPKGVGSTKVTATFKGLTKELAVTVYPTIASVDITKEEMDAFVDDTGAMPAVTGVTVADETKDLSKLVQWTSSDETVVSIGDDGKWKALKVGRATLTATVENEPNKAGATKTDTIVIDVHNKLLSVDSDVTVMSVVLGKEADLPAVKATYENGDEENITDKIVWKASSPNLLVKAPKVKGLKASTVTLTGTYLGKSLAIKVTIEEEFTSFAITPAKLQLSLNKSQSIKVVGKTKSGKLVTVSTRLDWIASDPDLVQIKGASIKGLLEGSGKLTAVIQGKTLEVPYTVTAKLTKLTGSTKSLRQVAVGTVENVTLTAAFDNGKSVDVTKEATWTTSNAKVATVSDGKITLVGKGSASIKAVYGGKTVTVSVSAK